MRTGSRTSVTRALGLQMKNAPRMPLIAPLVERPGGDGWQSNCRLPPRKFCLILPCTLRAKTIERHQFTRRNCPAPDEIHPDALAKDLQIQQWVLFHYNFSSFHFFFGCANFFLDARLLLLSFFRAELLCIAMWSVLSLLIKYWGSSFEARTV